MIEQTITGAIESIGPDKASEYLLKNAFNRPLKSQHVLKLARQMSMNLWRLTSEPIIFDENGNLQDGQHRLRGVIQSGKTIEFYVTHGSKEEAFVVMDTGQKRSFQDALYVAGFAQPTMYASLAGKIIRWERMVFFGGKKAALNPTNEEVVEYCKEHEKTLASSINFYLQSRGRINKIITSGVFLITYHLCKERNDAQAFDFFEKLITGSESKDDPKYQPIGILRKRLLVNKNSVAKIPHRLIVLMILGAWNAYRSNKQLHSLNGFTNLEKAQGKKIDVL